MDLLGPRDGTGNLLASSADFYGTDGTVPLNPDPHSHAVVGRRVYWSVIDWPPSSSSHPPKNDATGSEGPTFRILTTSADPGGDTTTLAKDAYGPSAAGSDLVYIVDSRKRTGAKTGTVRIQARSAAGGTRTIAAFPVGPKESVPTVCGTEDHVAWSLGRKGGRGAIYH